MRCAVLVSYHNAIVCKHLQTRQKIVLNHLMSDQYAIRMNNISRNISTKAFFIGSITRAQSVTIWFVNR
jgi:hypothetical protein